MMHWFAVGWFASELARIFVAEVVAVNDPFMDLDYMVRSFRRALGRPPQ